MVDSERLCLTLLLGLSVLLPFQHLLLSAVTLRWLPRPLSLKLRSKKRRLKQRKLLQLLQSQNPSQVMMTTKKRSQRVLSNFFLQPPLTCSTSRLLWSMSRTRRERVLIPLRPRWTRKASQSGSSTTRCTLVRAKSFTRLKTCARVSSRDLTTSESGALLDILSSALRRSKKSWESGFGEVLAFLRRLTTTLSSST